MEEELPAWRLVFEGVATLEQLQTSWSFDELVRANALLDQRAAMERAAQPQGGKP